MGSETLFKNILFIAIIITGIGIHGMDTVKQKIKIKPEKELPRVLIIGDSISKGYAPILKKLLAGKVQIFYPRSNCQHTGFGMKHIKKWLGNGKWDVIHFNWGIWDAHMLNRKGVMVDASQYSKMPSGSLHVRHSPKQYADHLHELIGVMRKSCDKLIWASTTPVLVPESNYLERIQALNKVAADIMKYQEIPTDDLYNLALPNTTSWLSEDKCHFNKLGYQQLANQVAKSILEELGSEFRILKIKPKKVVAEKKKQRTVVHYEHPLLSQWGFKKKKAPGSFLVVEPKVINQIGRPLLICLHSAGGNAVSESPNNIDRIVAAGDDFTGLLLNCPKGEEWWWGGDAIKKNPKIYGSTFTPTENRLFDTIEWVIQKYNIDRERVYLHGISMGGSGALGLAIGKGKIFAAVHTQVPALTEHARARISLNNHNIPYIVAMFSQKDSWAKDMHTFFKFVKKEKLGLTSSWGPWGHPWQPHEKGMPPEVYEFPWLSLKRNQAYPVVSNCSTNAIYPGFKGDGDDQIGQINGYIRWNVNTDQENIFRIQLRLVQKAELKRKPLKPLPKTATCNLSLRRIQNFPVVSGSSCYYTLEENGKLVASGMTTCSNGIITIKGLELMQRPRMLTLKY